jgi:hypothetical protein
MVERLNNMSNLVNSSMQGGNTTADAPALAMTAPGSRSVLPVAEVLDILPMPEWSNDTPIPVSNMARSGRVPAPAGPGNGPGPVLHTPITVPSPPAGKDTQPRNPPNTALWKEL